MSGTCATPSVLELVKELSQEAEEIVEAQPIQEFLRIDLFLFISFDLVGSTALKREKLSTCEWVDVIKHFYSHFQKGFATENGFSTWKYIGDEILFYKRITSHSDIEPAIRQAFRSMSDFELELENGQYDEAAPLISVKSVAWLAPIQWLTSSLASGMAKNYAELRAHLQSDDQVIGKLPEEGKSNEPFDFLGPNIDAGFRVAAFARRKQLVLSLALAYYLFARGACTNDLRIVAFEELKGIAKGKLYPIIWYNEKWDSIKSALPYEIRYRDTLLQRVCEGQYEPIDLLEEIHRNLQAYGYSFEKEILDKIIALSVADSQLHA